MKRNRFLAATLAVFLASSGAQAYPIFYKCDANGKLLDHLDTRDIETAVLAATNEAGLESKLVELCAGKTECMQILKQMLILTQSTVAAVKELLQEKIAELEAQAEALNEKIDPALSDTARNVVAMSNEIHACRKAQEGMDAGAYAFKDRRAVPGVTTGYDMFIHHRVENEYRRYTGVRTDPSESERIDYDQVGTVIDDAIAAGVDPYVALAISFMEHGKPKRFKLDPAPLLDMVGCPKKRIARVNHEDKEAIVAQERALRAQGTSFVYSFGTFYQITPGVRERKDISKLMMDRKEYYDADVPLSPALACKQGNNTFLARPNGEIIEVLESNAAPDLGIAKACCTKIPYASTEFFSAAANVFLKGKIASSTNPALAIQSFNGLGIIGLSEKKGVGSFRYGIDMGDDPQYGYQAMDSILNSFMSNSTIRFMVDRTSKELGTKPKSLLCSGKKAGAYAIDNDHYLKKQKDIVRLKPFINRPWSSFGSLERSSMEHEMSESMKWLEEDHPKLDSSQNARLRAGLERMSGASDASTKWSIYQKEVYPFRKTLYQTSAMSWKRLTNQETADLRMNVLAAPPQK